VTSAFDGPPPLDSQALASENARLRAALKIAAERSRPKGRFELDRTSGRHAFGGGAVCGAVGAYSQEIVDLINRWVTAGHLVPDSIWHLSIIQDGLGAGVGFAVGALMILLFKAIKRYP